MKRKSILNRQAVKGRKRKQLSSVWRIICLIGVSFMKFSVLLIALVVISLLFLGTYEYLLTSPYIKLQKVLITGVDRELKSKLLEMSELRFDLSLLAINLNKLKLKLEKHPWIRSVELEKHFPHTLVIRAKKEEPSAVVLKGKLYYMDRWGKIFKEIGPDEEIDYPVITVASGMNHDEETKLKIASRVLGSLRSENAPWSSQDISEIHVGDSGIVSLYFRDLPATITAKVDEFEMKIDGLKKVVEHLQRTGRIHRVRSISLDYDDGVVVSFRRS